jgi:polyferredoxin
MSEVGKGRPRNRWLLLRRLSQLFFLAAFIVLFLRTDYHGSDELAGAVNLLFRLDPFLAACVVLATGSLVVLLLPSLLVLAVTALFGRAFCGWFCPLGTLLDLSRRLFPSPPPAENRTRYPRLALTILFFCLVSSAGGLAVAGYVDPFSILVRGLAQVVYPLGNSLSVGFFTFTYQQLPEAVNLVTEPLYRLLQQWVLPASQKFFQLAWLSLAILAGVFLLEGWQRRFFCRNICPLGAMLGLVGRKALITGHGGDDDCGRCRLCAGRCRMGAIDGERRITMAACSLCYDCVQHCPRQVIAFAPGGRQRPGPAPSLSRRRLLGTAALALLLPAVKATTVLARHPDPLLIRPPGALAEEEFLHRCVRCGECLQVCIGNALQPALFQAGIDGLFSPLLVAKNGYCEFNCTLCGQVCPTGAIRVLSLAEKQRLKIGHAWFDRNTCLPYARGIPCMVCEEHCPTPEKAIRFRLAEVSDGEGRPVEVALPYVVDELCIGCGICENKCPLPDRPAIMITAAGEHRHPERALPGPPVGGASPYGG